MIVIAILNLANALTVSRLLLIPVFVYALTAEDSSIRWIAAVVFGLAALTDWLDGKVARRLNQVSEIGKVLDPLVDRIFIASTLIALYVVVRELIPLWVVLVIIGRDLAISLGWLFISRTGERLSVIYLGKLATALLMISFFLLFVYIESKLAFVYIVGEGLLYGGMVLSLASGLKYLKSGTSIIIRSNQASKRM